MLMEHSRVAVPELGTFILQFDEAFFGNNYEILYPPKSKIYFSPSVDRDYLLSTLLSEDGMLVDDAHLVENLLVKDYANSIINQVPFEFNELGTLINNLFIEKNKEDFNRYTGLKEINTKIIQQGIIKHDEDFTHYLKQPIQKSVGKSLNSLLWPALLAIFVSVITLIWVASRLNNTKVISEKAEQNISEDIKNDANVIYEKIDSSLLEQKDNVPIEMKPETIKNEVTPQPLKQSIKSKVNAPLINEAEDTINSRSKESRICVIIVGAFIDSSNAEKLAQKVRLAGYDVFKKESNGVKRVGIRYDCNTTNSETFKSKVKKTFTSEAWQLHDTL